MVGDASRAKALWPVLGRPGAVLHDGEIAGTRRPRQSGGKLAVAVELWGKALRAVRKAVLEEAERLAALRKVHLSAVDLGRSGPAARRLSCAGVAAFAEFTDPRLAAIYDTICPVAADPATAFYLGFAGDASPHSIIDLGCGTGSLTVQLAARGHDVIGVDPSSAMLDVARRRYGAELVRWVLGDSGCLRDQSAGLVIMKGHVVQLILEDEALAEPSSRRPAP